MEEIEAMKNQYNEELSLLMSLANWVNQIPNCNCILFVRWMYTLLVEILCCLFDIFSYFLMMKIVVLY